ncbi:MAG: crossover junction endodeoxyribonuclease RuvC [bacterium]
MRILGVDPGTVITGFGVLEKKQNECFIVDYGILNLSSQKQFSKRLQKIYDGISGVINLYQPDEFAIEDIFYAENARVALKMGHARGVAILAAVNHHLPTSEYSPREIKQSVVGNGGASKEQVQRMVQQILRMDKIPEPYDAADAIAVALCHLHHLESKNDLPCARSNR